MLHQLCVVVCSFGPLVSQFAAPPSLLQDKVQQAVEAAELALGTLSAADRLLIECSVRGTVYELLQNADSPRLPEQALSAACISWICERSDDKDVWSRRGIHLRGLEIQGDLVLSHLNVSIPITLERCRIKGDVRMQSCDLRALSLAGTTCDGSVLAADAHIRSTLNLNNGFRLRHSLVLDAATIQGHLDLTGAQVGDNSRPAISAPALSVAGNTYLRDGFIALGAVLLPRARLSGDLDVSGASFTSDGELSLVLDTAVIGADVFVDSGFVAQGGVSLSGAKVGGSIALWGSEIFSHGGAALRAQNLRVDGGLFLGPGMRDSAPQPFKAHGPIILPGARIGSILYCPDAVLETPGDLALDLTSASIEHGVVLNGRARCEGWANFQNSRIGGDALLDGLSIVSTGPVALSFIRATIDGDLCLCTSHDSTASDRHCDIVGEVSLHGATVSGDLVLAGAQLHATSARALVAEAATIRGGVFMTEGFLAEGELRMNSISVDGTLEFRSASVRTSAATHPAVNLEFAAIRDNLVFNRFDMRGGSLVLSGATCGVMELTKCVLNNPEGTALLMESAHVRSDLTIRTESIDELQSTMNGINGRVSFLDSQVDGNFVFKSSRIVCDTAVAMHCDRLDVAGVLLLDNVTIQGGLSLRAATARSLSDSDSVWSTISDFRIDDFVYATLATNDPGDLKWRLRWLERGTSNVLNRSAYETLALIYDSSGRRQDSAQVRIAYAQRERATARSLSGRIWYFVVGPFIGYGYSPSRVLLPIMVWLVPSVFLFWVGKQTGLVRARTARPVPFACVAFTIDEFFPLVDLHQSAEWRVDGLTCARWNVWRWIGGKGARRVGFRLWSIFFRCFATAHIIVGWILTSWMVLAIASLVVR